MVKILRQQDTTMKHVMGCSADMHIWFEDLLVSIERGVMKGRVATAVLYICPRPAAQTEKQTNKQM
jgi:hypothetical protein